MIRMLGCLLMAALFCFPRFSAAADTTLDDNACGTRQPLAVGDMLEVRLPGNPTTGYLWEAAGVPSQLRQQGTPVHRSDSRQIGGGGITAFTFKAVAHGDGTLELIYRRSWERDTPPLKTCRIQLKM